MTLRKREYFFTVPTSKLCDANMPANLLVAELCFAKQLNSFPPSCFMPTRSKACIRPDKCVLMAFMENFRVSPSSQRRVHHVQREDRDGNVSLMVFMLENKRQQKIVCRKVKNFFHHQVCVCGVFHLFLPPNLVVPWSWRSEHNTQSTMGKWAAALGRVRSALRLRGLITVFQWSLTSSTHPLTLFYHGGKCKSFSGFETAIILFLFTHPLFCFPHLSLTHIHLQLIEQRLSSLFII